MKAYMFVYSIYKLTPGGKKVLRTEFGAVLLNAETEEKAEAKVRTDIYDSYPAHKGWKDLKINAVEVTKDLLQKLLRGEAVDPEDS